jgi:O-antigen/teichoic acid export membrane protein
MLKKTSGVAHNLIVLFKPNQSAKNVIWNLAGGAWTGVLIVLATPWYVSLLGMEGYAILGLWLMMQVMMGLLDIGMGATLVREFADSRRDRNSLAFKRDLLRTLEIVYWVIAGLLVMVLVFVAGWAGDHWLNPTTLSNVSIANALKLMAIALGFQFPYALYLNGLAGLQEQGRMNAIQILGSSLRYGSGVAVLFWRADIVWFFAVQVLVSTVQTFTTRSVVWGILSAAAARPPAFSMAMLQTLWRFSAGMALTALLAVLLANADRIALSKMVPISELGKYAVAFTATGLLQLAIQPFYRAFFPRYAELVSFGDDKSNTLRIEYFQSCRMMAAAIIPLGIIGWVFAPHIFNAWLGNIDETTIDIFRWLLIGITCSGLMWLPAAFQQAHGWTRLHSAMIGGALVVGTPVMVWAILVYGTVGATVIWILHGFSDITLGLWLMHRRLLIGKLLVWYRSVLLPPLLVSLPIVGISRLLIPIGMSRWFDLCWIGLTGLVVIAANLFLYFGRFHRNIPESMGDIHIK